MEKTIAQTNFYISVECPYCGAYQHVTEELKEHLDIGELRAEECDAEVRCEDCHKVFIVEQIEY